MENGSLPFEIAEFERLLVKPNSDPTGLASFFNSGEIWIARVHARLDVIGGIADYSGANVCEAVLGRGMLMALQPRTDRTLRIRTVQIGQRSLPIETRIPLDYFQSGDGIAEYSQVRAFCQANPLTSWAAYIGGSIFPLLHEESVKLPYGFSMLLLSAVPMNVGIGSSAAVEISTLQCLNAYLGLKLDAARLARLGQMAENYCVDAPCGIMDQTAIVSGHEGCLSHILCRPGQVMGEVAIPPGAGFVGINSMVRHSVAGNPYSDTRIGAFMGKKMINEIRARTGRAALNYLTELSPKEFCDGYEREIPEAIVGSEFLKRFKTHDDPVTTIQPDATYRVVGPTRHPVEENERVLKFMDALRAARNGDEQALITAGKCMYGAHASYRDNCQLSVDEVNFLVEAVQKRGAASGLYGAKITGGGTGGTVAVFGKLDALKEHIPQIATEYSRRIGVMPGHLRRHVARRAGIRRPPLRLRRARVATAGGLRAETFNIQRSTSNIEDKPQHRAMSDIKPQNPELLTDCDVNYAPFHCCGDEDLVFIKCPDCQHVMVFCYECDTLYQNLSDLTVLEPVSLTKSTGRVTCPKCKVRFADYKFLVDKYLVTAAEVIAAGYGHLLSDEIRQTHKGGCAAPPTKPFDVGS